MIEKYVEQVYGALQSELYFPALALALALPDVCGAAEYPEYPPENSTGKRYIEWYDKFVKEYMSNEDGQSSGGDGTSWISGEVVLSLRNTFLHTGSPNIDSSRIKNKANQFDKFLLALGDGSVIWSITNLISKPHATVRTLIVDITYLCQTICKCALWYYKHNKDKFRFNFKVVTQEELLKKLLSFDSEEDARREVADRSKEDSANAYRSERVINGPEDNPSDLVCKGLSHTQADEDLKQKVSEAKSSDSAKKTPTQPVPKSNPDKKNAANNQKTEPKTDSKKKQPDKREEEIRCFFGQNFKEEEYKQKKEQIIQAVLSSGTKQQVNCALQSVFKNGEVVSAIYKRLLPLIKSLPGK